MAYDGMLAGRVRILLRDQGDVSEKEMFGGLAFLLEGKMCVGVRRENLMVRVGPERYEEALRLPHARNMDFTGRPMRGWVYVGPGGYRKEQDLARWVAEAVEFVKSLR